MLVAGTGDPCVAVEELGKQMGLGYDTGKLLRLSMGQGQESFAETAIARLAKSGGWVLLQVCCCCITECFLV